MLVMTEPVVIRMSSASSEDSVVKGWRPKSVSVVMSNCRRGWATDGFKTIIVLPEETVAALPVSV